MTTNPPSILIVEDEPALAELIGFTLREAGWAAQVTTTVADAWQNIVSQKPQLVLLDWMLPDQSGLRLLARMRADEQSKSTLVMMVTARAMEEDRVSGLDQGADDYLTKPFSPRELTARVRALLRRRALDDTPSVIEFDTISLDPSNCTVSLSGVPGEMGHAEYRLLEFFLRNPERVFTRGQLLDRVWGHDADIEERTVDVHVLRLRKALKDSGALIKTVRSVGYMISRR